MRSQSKIEGTRERLRHHYEVEIELADRLRKAPPVSRGRVYGEVYDELFRQVPDHPQLSIDASYRDRVAADRLEFVMKFCNSNSTLLEIGAGDCAFSALATTRVRRVVAVDVSEEIMDHSATTSGVETHVIDGTTFPIESGSVDAAFSDQLIEHLHPDDVAAQIREVRRVLAPRGVYLCITPNRAGGPHDVSRYFNSVARGFHLVEYNSRELKAVFKSAGFNRFRFYLGGRGTYVHVPGLVVSGLERLYGTLPRSVRLSPIGSTLSYVFLGLNLVADTRSS